MKQYKFTFIDLFAGIGGFHQAMRFLGGKCVMASEINQACVETYKLNFKDVDIRGDIRKIDPNTIPKFDVLCGGFPCQSFSKAGKQKGFEDETRGDLFHYIMRILDVHPETKFVILENVRNLADKEEHWQIIKKELTKRDFYITEDPIIISPSDFGLPQIRERVYILGIKNSIRNKKILTNGCIHDEDINIEKYKKQCKMGDAWKILENNVDTSYYISEQETRMINAWNEFRIAIKKKTIGFPIWLDSFGIGINDEQEYRNKIKYNEMKDWKKKIVDNNRELYLKNKKFIDKWIKDYDMMNKSKLFKKFEWNCGEDCNDIKESIIQIRQSGIRAKRPTYFPSLVAIVNTPIIWDENIQRYRHITPREAANLQNFDRRYKFIGTDKEIYKQLGNSVNVKVLKRISKNLFKLGEEGWDENGKND